MRGIIFLNARTDECTPLTVYAKRRGSANILHLHLASAASRSCSILIPRCAQCVGARERHKIENPTATFERQMAREKNIQTSKTFFLVNVRAAVDIVASGLCILFSRKTRAFGMLIILCARFSNLQLFPYYSSPLGSRRAATFSSPSQSVSADDGSRTN